MNTSLLSVPSLLAAFLAAPLAAQLTTTAAWQTRFARFATSYRATTGGGLRCKITESTHATMARTARSAGSVRTRR